MSRLILQRSSIRTSFMKVANELREELDKLDKMDNNALKMLWRRLEDRFLNLEKVDDEILQSYLERDVSQEDMDEEYNSVQEYRDIWIDLNCKLDVILKPEDSVERQEETKRYKLPKLKLVEFSGSPREWLSFWSQFKGIHNDNGLSAEEKFQYLIQATTVESDARRVVASFPPTAENYQKAIDHLKARFGKDKVLIEVYVRDLLKLVLKNANSRQEIPLSTLYDDLETKLRGLESLGVTTDKYAAMLYPLVESALSEDVLRTWERIRNQRNDANTENDQLKQLMQFLRGEVESDIRLKMAKRGITDEQDDGPKPKHPKITFEHVTATDLLNKDKVRVCIFCGISSHLSRDCSAAKNMPLNEKLQKIREAKSCFRCLKGNHWSNECRARIFCQACNGTHYRIMCNKINDVKKPLIEINSVSTYQSGVVILQTLLITIEHGNMRCTLRALIDTGSERSYITKRTVTKFGYKPIGMVDIAHCLFGGHITNIKKHKAYNVEVFNMKDTSKMQLELLDVDTICGNISSIPKGSWIQELMNQDIVLSDYTKDQYDIDILIGADIASVIYTGNIYRTIEGPVAFETKLGWTLMGKSTKTKPIFNTTLLLHSLHVSNAKVQDLWKLDIIGINDPIENRNRKELTMSALKHFKEKVCKLEDGRYEVELPWIEGHTAVGTNMEIAKKRLNSTFVKLQRLNKLDDYQRIFDKWLELGIIEEILDNKVNERDVSYLPHHPVFNPKSSTTPIRPVFDASAKSKGHPSLNDCLEKGPNLIEFIPSILIRFRMKQYGTTSDIEKAFLQISVAEKDRNYLRFLWYNKGQLQIFRHCRVVFGIKASPFLLAATLSHHMDSSSEKVQKTAELLKSSTYIDNCVASVDTKGELKEFIQEATSICSEAKFNLRNWVWNGGDVITEDVPGVGSSECGLGASSYPSQETSIIPVLGLLWDTQEDTLALDLRNILSQTEDIVTKRKILAATHKIFDPLGFVSPVTIVPKMLLQEVFKKKLKWDEQVPEEITKRFTAWMRSVECLQAMKIPRWMMVENARNKSLHVFTDASKGAYAAVAFMRVENENAVNVQLVMAKARVSTIKPMSIPKLELVGCECGARLAHNLRDTIDMTDIKLHLWSDSSNALSWIKRKENWQIFVFNRVKTIKELTNPDDWKHIPGELNPADLPSRGCTAKQLLANQWWKGPEWLKDSEANWPKSEITANEEVVMAEKKKTVVSHLIQDLESHRYFKYFSQFRKVVRMIAWMRRWRFFKKNKQSGRNKDLTSLEEEEAEIRLWKMIQSENFEENKGIIKQLNAFKDQQGIWRLKTRLLLRHDSEDFKFPILLPKNHVAVECFIRKEHLERHHSGQQILRSSLRERFWIVNSRVAVRKVVNSCGRCKRFGARKFTAPEAPLPLNRIRDTAVFEVTGIDLGGPLYLIDEEKSWFVIFTCAVYRAIHLELVTSLSTEGFIQALRRFIARRGRPEVIYTDNGTNFVGTENLMKQLDWDEIVATTTARKIKWIFNPPSAPWWGGWWERLVRMVKQLLRCNLGRRMLNYEEMTTILCDCELVINSRPLTYLTEDPNELVALTPIMFLNDIKNHEVIDLDTIESTAFKEKFKYRQEIRQELRDRFRKEYLSELVHHNMRQAGKNNIEVGDLVLMEIENKKRIDWPIAEVLELFPSSDGIVRSVRLRTRNKETIRAIQRLYPLETSVQELKNTGYEREVTKVIDKHSKKSEVDKDIEDKAKGKEDKEKENEDKTKEEEDKENKEKEAKEREKEDKTKEEEEKEAKEREKEDKTKEEEDKENKEKEAKDKEDKEREEEEKENKVKTRSGRIVKKPERFSLLCNDN